MCTTGRSFFLIVAAVSFAMAACSAQDEPSLGDVARQVRQQKQAKAVQGKGAKPVKVITNEQLPQHSAASAANDENSSPSDASATAEKPAQSGKMSAEQWKSQIQTAKSQIDALQHQSDELNDSIHFAPANCVQNCAQWNELQKQKQEEVEHLRSLLEEQKKRLEDLQETARKQGYGSSVYDP
ncbi:MAG TPA: hypothetical protein VMU61_08530 [Candidatus Aquilonibacter sp.]|nr:hypothetical protein [Candidatus Aquilonibacter sp.]